MDPHDPAGERLTDGTPVRIRPIRPDDEARMADFHASLSTRSVYHRYFHLATLEQRTAHARLALTCRTDPAVAVAGTAIGFAATDIATVVPVTIEPAPRRIPDATAKQRFDPNAAPQTPGFGAGQARHRLPSRVL